MIIDILSDIHIDFYFRFNPTPQAVESIYSHIFTDNQKRDPGDVLIIAGDLGHNNRQNIKTLILIKQIFGYRHIICVLGNHDYYLVDLHTRMGYESNSLLRAENMRKLINKEEGMHCLDGEVIEIDGIRIGGCDGWYDGKYTKKHFYKRSDKYLDTLWNNTMADSHYIEGMDWLDYSKKEKEKIEKIYQDIDVMVTHINPSINKEHTSHSFREEQSTGFFTFDGSRYLENGSMKYWIYGHTHTEMEYEVFGVKCICNPMGYPGENGNGEWTWIKSIEI